MSEFRTPAAAAERHELAKGAFALGPGLLWLQSSRAIVAADTHLAYEDVIGGALPTWSTPEIAGLLLRAARRWDAREVIVLGDVIHGSRMSEGAARAVIGALDALRAEVTLTLVAGNHEGRTRGFEVLGETVESTERDCMAIVPRRRARVPRSDTCIRACTGEAPTHRRFFPAHASSCCPPSRHTRLVWMSVPTRA